MNQVAVIALVLGYLACPLSGLPGGAPAEACNNLLPSPTNHGTTIQSTDDNPYFVNMTGLPEIPGSGFFGYEPDTTYVCKLQQFLLRSCDECSSSSCSCSIMMVCYKLANQLLPWAGMFFYRPMIEESSFL
jgi:hypothetical protein